MNDWTVHHGDCLDVLRSMPDDSVDAVVTDPPYGLSFMGKKWDYDVPSVEVWAECLRVLKPGGHLLAFAGTRTQHRMAVNIEDAGFDIRDMIAWVYGSGFPKSLDVSKAIDRMRKEDASPRVAVTAWVADQMEARGVTRRQLCDALGVANQPIQSWSERNADYAVIPTWDRWLWLKAQVGFDDSMDAEVWRLNGRKGQPGDAWAKREVVGVQKNAMSGWDMDGGTKFADRNITAPATEAAKQWAGWGTALKPALEPITVARKPLSGTVAENVLRYGTGGVNVDGCRVEGEKGVPASISDASQHGWRTGGDMERKQQQNGRWPANLIHDGSDEVVGLFPGTAKSAGGSRGAGGMNGRYGPIGAQPEIGALGYGDSGSAARFFYCAKASKADRDEGCEGLEAIHRANGNKWTDQDYRVTRGERPPSAESGPRRNHHPTVKPTDLMRYLCRLVTPPGGLILDPFTGSGSTGKAAVLEGFRFVGIEREAEYVEIAKARIGATASDQLTLL